LESQALISLRDYLEQRERELLDELGPLYSEVKRREAELAEIRRAKVSIGMAGPWRDTGLARFDAVEGLAKGITAPTALQHPAYLQAASGTVDPLLPSTLLQMAESPHADLTMKQLVVKALEEHFHNGAPTRAMLEFFRDAWSREIERTNLSPQLSRLYQEGVIGRIRSTRGWFLFKKDGVIEGFRPYLHQGRIIWSDPNSTTEEHEPLLAKDIAAEVARDRMPYKRITAVSGSGTFARQRMVWLHPHEVLTNDAPALRHEFPAPIDDDDS
jgi:hypothetical protein